MTYSARYEGGKLSDLFNSGPAIRDARTMRRRIVSEAADRTLRDVQERTPVRSGRTRDSWYTETSETPEVAEAAVASDYYLASFLEYGTAPHLQVDPDGREREHPGQEGQHNLSWAVETVAAQMREIAEPEAERWAEAVEARARAASKWIH